MNNILKSTVAGVGAAILLLGISAAHADSPNAAVVLKDLDHPFGCFAFVPVTFTPLFTADEIHTTATSNGNVQLTCHFNITEGFEPATAVKTTGFGCGIFLPSGAAFTTDTSMVANPGGRATLKCLVKG
jgi:hypothetical protein